MNILKNSLLKREQSKGSGVGRHGVGYLEVQKKAKIKSSFWKALKVT